MGHRRHCCNGMRGVYTDLFGSIDSPFVDSEGSMQRRVLSTIVLLALN
jgi:hypothetical protein